MSAKDPQENNFNSRVLHNHTVLLNKGIQSVEQSCVSAWSVCGGGGVCFSFPSLCLSLLSALGKNIASLMAAR